MALRPDLTCGHAQRPLALPGPPSPPEGPETRVRRAGCNLLTRGAQEDWRKGRAAIAWRRTTGWL
jgi:hypothetical protein